MVTAPSCLQATFLPRTKPRFPFAPPTACERRKGQGERIDFSTGELTPLMCGSNSCPYCARVKLRQIARAVGAAQPTHMITLTRCGDEWKQIQRRMNKMLERLRSAGYSFEWVWLVECNWDEHKHFHHVHALAYGDLPDAPTLTEFATRSGFGPVAQQKVLSDLPSGVRYLWSPRKQRAHQLTHFLHMNGGRLQHSTRGFWRVAGQPVKGMDQAIKQSRYLKPEDQSAVVPAPSVA